MSEMSFPPILSLQPAALDAYAGTQQQVARDVGATALRGRSDVGDLSVTFGLIGADFLAATALALDARARRLDDAAARHRAVGTGTTRANTAYRASDTSSAQRLGGVAAPDTGLSL